MAGEGTLTERRVVRRMCEMCESTYSEEGSVVMDTSREERPRKMRGNSKNCTEPGCVGKKGELKELNPRNRGGTERNSTRKVPGSARGTGNLDPQWALPASRSTARVRETAFPPSHTASCPFVVVVVVDCCCSPRGCRCARPRRSLSVIIFLRSLLHPFSFLSAASCSLRRPTSRTLGPCSTRAR